MKIERKFYPDGSHFAKIVEFPKENEVPEITHWINNYADLYYLLQVKDACANNGINPILNIPCLLDAQADKRFARDESANLKVLCGFINYMKFAKVRVFHPHNPEVVEALLDNVEIVDNHEFIMDVLDFYPDNSYENLILMSTDAGGYKPLMKLADKIGWTGEVYAASKSRRWDESEKKSILTQEVGRTDFEGKDILIVDDLSIYGGTFIGLFNLLADRNCGSISLAVSHITVKTPNKQLEQFHTVYTTSSKFKKEDYQLNNVVVLNVQNYI